MRPDRVYLLHPAQKYLPGIKAWIGEVESLLRDDPSWGKWDLLAYSYNDQNSFDVQPMFVRVLNKPGPVILLESVQAKALGNLREKLRTHAVVILRAVTNSTDLWDVVEEARRRHEEGEPLLPRKLVVAVLIVRKLRKLNHWGGNAKGYLWHYDLAKGRGVDDRFADVVHEVANDLLTHGILIDKTSQGLKKYALNPNRKAEVHAIADTGTFFNKHLERILMRDLREESASYLYETKTAQSFTILSGNVQLHQCVSVSDAISHAKGCQDGAKYEAKVEFQKGHVLHEVFEERRVLIQFLEAFL
ncbi:MAG TPA: hypothetical protein VH643_11665 [Gemmataceae bacterium]|jgi:hypothetical protein